MPRVPGAPSGRRARTRWQTFSAKSLSAQVMKIFGRHYLSEAAEEPPPQTRTAQTPTTAVSDEDAALQGVICDEEAIDRP